MLFKIQTTEEVDKVIAEVSRNNGDIPPIDVIRRALALYAFIVNETSVGGELLIKYPDNTLREVVVK